MYEYEVFLSYKRGKIREEWLHEIFKPLFEMQLEESLGHRCNIFIDQKTIPPGVDWPDYLSEALSKSKCLVAILSPSYFGSQWCMKEFNAMHYRQTELRKKKILAKEYSVIVPFVKQGPMDVFPDFVDRIQLLDYSMFNKIGEAFKKSELYLEMQGKIERDAQQTAQMIKNAPAWLPEFEKMGWSEDQALQTQVMIQSKPNF
ncbi:MAG: toll/interleukin-1 receptor domain-containing protein [Saprospiraceae bacterium]|nr:toll/interleukin-1 receptor domain-containing protein [Saprospiraceae bacterium]